MMTKDKKSKRSIKLTLTRSQIEDLYRVSQHFKEIDLFELVQNHDNGIGPSTKVKFSFIEKSTEVDLTDYESW